MKVVLFDVSENSNNFIHDIILNNDNSDKVREIVFSKKFLLQLTKESDGIFNKIKYYILNKKFTKVIMRGIDFSKIKWYYLLSKNFSEDEKKLLKIKFQELLGYEYTTQSEMEKNLDKHILDYISKNDKNMHDIKILLIYNLCKNLNISFIKSLIERYKLVDILLNENPSNYILKQIKSINNTYGTTTQFIKKDRKSFKDYDIIYFVGKNKEDFSKLRFNKNSLIIDNKIEMDDKFNSNIIFLDEYINLHNNKDIINKIINNYGKLNAATIIKNLK